jgi:hypothetical protein
VNNSDERDYEEEAANQRMMEEERESEGSDISTEPTHCDVCGRLMSTHIICDGPDAMDNQRDYDILPDPFN